MRAAEKDAEQETGNQPIRTMRKQTPANALLRKVRFSGSDGEGDEGDLLIEECQSGVEQSSEIGHVPNDELHNGDEGGGPNSTNNNKQQVIEELYKKLSDALDSSGRLSSKHEQESEELRKRVAALEANLAKTEQKLQNSNEEKEYYKKQQFAPPQEQANHVVNGGDRDDFGHDLMLANKRNYQLEGRVRQLSNELHESRQLTQSLERELRNTERLLWLEKERGSTIEGEMRQNHLDLNEFRSSNEELKKQLNNYLTALSEHGLEMQGASLVPVSAAPIEENAEAEKVENLPTLDQRLDTAVAQRDKSAKEAWYEKELERRTREFDVRIEDVLDLKAKVEWRLGEVTQSWHDARWRVGELEATIAHKDYERDQLENRVKQLESVMATPMNNMSDALGRLEEELVKVRDEKAKSDWHLGEYKQWFDDAKWRVGELESSLFDRDRQLDESHLRIGGLERRLELRLWELEDQAKHSNTSTSNIAELQRNVDELREQKSKIEWRLGEITQYWNDSKWRVGELEASLEQREGKLRELEEIQGRLPTMDALTHLEGCFVFAKKPCEDRQRWPQLLTWENMCRANPQELRQCWFEIELKRDMQGPTFLTGSFFGWEVAILMQPFQPGYEDTAQKFGTWLKLPTGRHEFLFITAGKWQAAPNYQKAPNEYGDFNNWMVVE